MEQASWIDSFNALVDQLKDRFAKMAPDVIAQAEEDASTSLTLTDTEQNEIQSEVESAIDDTIDQTVSDINDELGSEAESGVASETASIAKTVTGFFIGGVIARALKRLHGATIARQTEGDKGAAQDSAIKTGESEIDAITAAELAMTYSRTAKEHQESQNVAEFIWRHGGSSDPRPEHIAANGETFTWESGLNGVFPGDLFNCSCWAEPVNPINNRASTMNKKAQFFNLKTEDESSHIYMNGIVGDYDFWTDEGIVFNEFKTMFEQALKAGNVVLHVNSPGGFIYDGVAIYHLIKEHADNVEIRVEGMAGSIMSIIMLAVPYENRYIMEGSLVFIHNPWGCVCGDDTDLENAANGIKVSKHSLAEIYAERTALDFEEALKLMAKETSFGVDDAVAYGFAQKGDGEAKGDADEFSEFVSALKTCAVEQRDHKKTLLNYAIQDSTTEIGKNLTGKTMPTIDELKNQLATAKSEQAETQAKLDVLTGEANDLKAENKQLTDAGVAQAEQSITDIETAKAEAFTKAKAELSEAANIREQAKAKGFKAEGETSSQIMADVCVEAGMNNVDKISAESLPDMFNFAMERREDSTDPDDALNPESTHQEDDEFTLPAKGKN